MGNTTRPPSDGSISDSLRTMRPGQFRGMERAMAVTKVFPRNNGSKPCTRRYLLIRWRLTPSSPSKGPNKVETLLILFVRRRTTHERLQRRHDALALNKAFLKLG